MPHAPVGIIATPGGRALAEQIDAQLIKERQRLVELHEAYRQCPGFLRESYLIESSCPRFSNGEGKAVITESIRGFDLYVVTDIGNWGQAYVRNGVPSSMSPDEHYQDLKRLISATRGLGMRMNAILPLLYGGRQHKISGRESLDCALALQELVHLDVENIMTIDAHNAHVQNAIPNYGFENLHANYQHIKAILQNEPEFAIGRDNLVVASPDLGGLERCRYFAEQLHAELTAFYKHRDVSKVVNGQAPVLEHRFIGGEVQGKDVLIVDDMISSGGSVLEVARVLREMGVGKILIVTTFGLFTDGVEPFIEAHRSGIFTRLYATNATYTRPELAEAEWYVSVDISRFIALYIDSFNRNESVSRLLDNTSKIRSLLKKRGLL
jgi:ribose-phosphate pyrophosphokinase